jgi:hypothetical protein
MLVVAKASAKGLRRIPLLEGEDDDIAEDSLLLQRAARAGGRGGVDGEGREWTATVGFNSQEKTKKRNVWGSIVLLLI